MQGIMVQGTASNVGKSLVATVLCRLFADEGCRVAPFKSQNMSSYTSVLPSGEEIARSQVLQAEAAKTEPSVWMNPIVLKPSANGTANLLLLGKPFDTYNGSSYRNEFYTTGLQAIRQSLEELTASYEMLVAEGAGSPVEVNLKDRDLVNMKVAELADLPVLLIADIDRGGVFASIAGTLALLEPSERKRVQGIVINKFRGDAVLFTDGIKWIETYTDIPVVGLIPPVEHGIAGEDALAEMKPEIPAENQSDIYAEVAARVKPYLNWTKIKDIAQDWSRS